MKAIIGKKVGMSQIFDENGHVIPVTVIEAGPCVVVQKKTVEKEGYEAVQWSVDSLDWKNISPEDMIRRAGDVQSGDIILFHNDSQYLLDALPTLLKSYQEKGLKMVKVSEILLEGETTIDVQGKQHPTAVQDTSKER